MLVGTAKAQKQVELLAEWLRSWSESFGAASEFWKNAYASKHAVQSSPFYPVVWKESEETFRNLLKGYLSLIGGVPMEEHMELVEKYEELKEKSAEQEESIEHLRALLSREGIIDYGYFAREYQDFVKKQTKEYQKVMENFSKLFSGFKKE